MQKLVIIVGIPGIGKSTYIKKLMQESTEEYTCLSSDKLRAKFGSSEEDQSVTPQVFSYIHEQVNILLSSGKNVIIDATNIKRRDREGYIKLAKRYSVRVIVYVLPLDRDLAIKRNKLRAQSGGRNVPEFVIDKMITNYTHPVYGEGIDELIYINE